MTVEIRPERPEEAATIRQVTEAAFALAEHRDGTEGAIIDALRQLGGLSVSLVAIEAGAIVGHVAFSPVLVAGEDRNWFGLGPVSVLPDRQRQGIGDALVRAGLARLEGMGAGGCVVLGDPDYYHRFGFRAESDLRYEGVPPEYFMALSFGGETPTGAVIYHAGFSAT
ncbi:GNAT family N-acetyltransferase [Sneathiella chinensis]|uniref:GNAT family N-acetyltransferase n=1 Tax=Sneathiella chinensis TaxID=349750 RepID=A0ABQ5U134_9PROT|nr:N-acetyltransferase [Sneathiella chinensis]GLQ05371.1 GNAT family N-acetyltransferase [Sneathiella chinensis]